MTHRPVFLAAVSFSAAVSFLALSPAARALPPTPKLAQKATPKKPLNLRKFMPVSELKPGMRGYALTVFKGTKIEKFGIEILGVVSKFNQGKDYILFRATDGPPVTQQLNIAHGMSGSPIYIDGRLVGAISMGIPARNSDATPSHWRRRLKICWTPGVRICRQSQEF